MRHRGQAKEREREKKRESEKGVRGKEEHRVRKIFHYWLTTQMIALDRSGPKNSDADKNILLHYPSSYLQ